MAKENSSDSGEDKPIIIFDGASFTEKQLLSIMTIDRRIVASNGRRTGKIEFSARFVEALVKSVNAEMLKSAEKPKPFYETLNEQKRRRSWRR
jgi:hypothetical protein